MKSGICACNLPFSLPDESNAGEDQSICDDETSLSGNIPTIGEGVWIQISGSGTIDDDDNKLEELINWATPLMIKFREVFGPLVKNIQIDI